MKVNNKFNFGEILYLKTDKANKPRIMTGISIMATKGISYNLSTDEETTIHFDCEISREANNTKVGFNK